MKSLWKNLETLGKHTEAILTRLDHLAQGVASSGKYSLTQWVTMAAFALTVAMAVGGLVTYQSELRDRGLRSEIDANRDLIDAAAASAQRDIDALRAAYQREIDVERLARQRGLDALRAATQREQDIRDGYEGRR